MPSVTLNYSAQVGQEFCEAVGTAERLTDANGEIRPATPAEAKRHLENHIKQMLFRHRRRAAAHRVDVADVEIT